MTEEKREVPLILHEAIMSHMERTIRRLWILCIVLLIALVGTNAAWIIYENQFEDIVITQETDGEGDNNYVDGDGSIINY